MNIEELQFHAANGTITKPEFMVVFDRLKAAGTPHAQLAQAAYNMASHISDMDPDWPNTAGWALDLWAQHHDYQ